MGACDFYTIAFGKGPDDAYRRAVDEALYQHGHDSYNGTISTTTLRGPHALNGTVKRWTQAGLTKLRDLAMSDKYLPPKWECEYIEITGKLARELKKQNGYAGTHKKVYLFVGLAAC